MAPPLHMVEGELEANIDWEKLKGHDSTAVR